MSCWAFFLSKIQEKDQMEKINFQRKIEEMEAIKEKQMQENRYLKDTDLAKRFSVSRPTIWRWVAKGDFPAPVQLSPGCSRWFMPGVEEWEKGRLESIS